jgi:Bacterial transglutaminase-like N-terminal region/Circularly permuted ATP-grasp type 2
MAASPETTTERDTASLDVLVATYRPLLGIFDEMIDDGGRVRPHWRPLLDMLATLGPEEINRRFAAADRYLRSSGVFYRVYEDAAGIERPWPISHVPLILDPTEWRELAAGLVQRAELLETVLADAYGPSQLTRDGRCRTSVDEALRRRHRRLSDQHRTRRRDARGTCMIYDVRQSSAYVYASPVAHARHVLRQLPINRNGQRVHLAALQIVPEPRHRREGEDFFGNRLTWVDVDAPHQNLTIKLTARVSVDPPSPTRRRRPRGRRRASWPSVRATSGRPRPPISCLQAAWPRSIPLSATMHGLALRPAGRSLTAQSSSCGA